MVDNSNAEDNIASYSLTRFVDYCILASSTLLWFDIVLTFPTEMRCIWRRRFSGATLVYLFTRYTALAHQALLVTKVLLLDSNDQTCDRISRPDDVLQTLNIFATSAFTILGVYSVWSPDWKPLLVVIPLTLVKLAVGIYEFTHYTPTQDWAWGCFYDFSFSNTTLSILAQISGIMTILPNAILICLTWIKTFSIHRTLSEVGIRTPLTTLLLREGTAFLIVLFLSRIVVIVSRYYIRAPSAEATLLFAAWPYFDQVLNQILLWRFLLKACGLHFANRRSHVDLDISASSFVMPEIRFDASRVLGNLDVALPNPAPPEDSSDVQARRAQPYYNPDIEEDRPNALQAIAESTLSELDLAA